MNDIRIAAAYIRVSTDDQIEYSPDAQLVEIRKYAAAHGFIIPPEFVFVDEGISGKKTEKRNAFNRMVGAAKHKPKPFDAILLWKFSRFARNREDSIVYKSMLRRELGIDVISISEPLSDDKMSIIMEAMIEAMDEYYSINLAEEVKRGMTEKARRGGLQSTPPFGYRVENNILVVAQDEAELVRAIFTRFIHGEGLFPIAKWLNDIGVTTHRGSRFENRTVEYILRNPVYVGKLRWNPAGRTYRDFDSKDIIVADGKHDAIITDEIWDAAQARMAAVKAQWRYHGRPLTEHKDWLSGLIRCSSCGCTLVFSKPHYWKCNGYARGACKVSQHISDEKLKSMFLASLQRDQRTRTKIKYKVINTSPSTVNESALLNEQMKQINVKLSRLRDAYLSGVEDINSYKEAKLTLDGQLATITDRLSSLTQLPSPEKTTNLIKQSIVQCTQVLTDPNSSMEKKHSAVHEIIEKCVFDKNANTLQIYYRLTQSIL